MTNSKFTGSVGDTTTRSLKVGHHFAVTRLVLVYVFGGTVSATERGETPQRQQSPANHLTCPPFVERSASHTEHPVVWWKIPRAFMRAVVLQLGRRLRLGRWSVWSV